jgi:hypothetical protein
VITPSAVARLIKQTVSTIRRKSSGGGDMTETRRTTTAEARRVGDAIGVDWSSFELEQFRAGMDVEFEHGAHDPQTDVTGDDPIVTGKIALAQMKEFPDYYERLERMEREAARDWGRSSLDGRSRQRAARHAREDLRPEGFQNSGSAWKTHHSRA